ncbi:MAG TPA: ribokinase [Candidatus Binatia bacterium]|jgi:ribokinase|nr:ribokinase [Candidatus Binatia bacterium]
MPRPIPRVVVVGSLNLDFIATVERLPTAGETVPAMGLLTRFGGKGANQAVAAARQGASVSLLGCVGSDDAGHAYRRRLRTEGINVTGILTSKGTLTGTALIAVARSAENTIVVAAGANGELRPTAIRRHRELIASANLVLLQLEIPMLAVLTAVRIANRANVPVVLNPSPLREDFPWKKCRIDTLISNALEAHAIFGLPVQRLRSNLAAWRNALEQRRIGRLLITRGSKSTLFLTANDFAEVPTLPVKPVDTVGAGDAFAGAFVARLAESGDVLTAMRYANCAGALATLKSGAQEAIPGRTATEKALRKL